MVDQQQPEATNPDLATSLRKSGIDDTKKEEKGPFYKVIGDSKVPVSRHYGGLWKSRKKQGIEKRERTGVATSWREAVRYYENDQLFHRTEGVADRSQNEAIARRRNGVHSETENVVFANMRALVPAIYAKNPHVEVTATAKNDQARMRKATQLERVLNAVISKKSAPGVNLKPKARRAVVMTALTNQAWLEVGYTLREQSSEAAFEELTQQAEVLAKAKKPKDIEEAEGILMAIEKKIDALSPSGPFVKFRTPDAVIRDPDGIEEDLSDSNWIMVRDFLPTQFILAAYARKNEDGVPESIYKPTHILKVKGGDQGHTDEEVNNFSLLQDTDEFKQLGFDDEHSFKKAQRTMVWWVWDKVSRRVFLYNDDDWSWPIWVWDDPYKLDRFFPLYSLSFYTNPLGGESKGEVTYYLDQQDAINEINDEERRARLAAKSRIGYNKNIIKPEDFEAWASGTKHGLPLDLPADNEFDIKKHIYALTPPSLDFPQVFDKRGKYEAIDRISSTSDVQRGVQFKTNTTNRAIDAYQAVTNTTLDEKVDAVEDLIADVSWGLAQLCLQHLTKEQVVTLIGEADATDWDNMQPAAIAAEFNFKTAGGSSAKPTSKAKKQEAIEVGQVLGQFVNVAPEALIVALELFEQAFDEIVISEEDWRNLRQKLEERISGQQGGGSSASPPATAPGQASAGRSPALLSGQQGTQTVDTGQAAIVQALQLVSQLVDQLPAQAKQAFGSAVAQGVPAADALQQIVQTLSAQGGTGAVAN